MFRHLYERLRLPCRESAAFSPGAIEPLGTGHITESKRETSARLESFLLHTRVLRDFFYYFEFKKDKTKRRWTDDVMAQDFVPGWGAVCTPIGGYLRDTKEPLDKALAHLTSTRVRGKEKQPRWEVVRVYDELQPVIDRFLAALPPESRSWFDEPEDVPPA